jgi:hypothetical protein
VVVIVIIGIVLHPRFVVIGKCMAYKCHYFLLALFQYSLQISEAKGRIRICQWAIYSPIIYVSKRDKKAFSFAELHSQMLS